MVKKKDKKTYKDSEEGIGIAGFTLGVLSIIFMGSIGILTGIVGIVFCYMQQRKTPTKLAKIGMILSTIGLIAGIAFVVGWAYYISPAISEMANFPVQ